MTARTLRPLLIALALFATSCGGSTSTTTDAPAEDAAETTAAPETTAAETKAEPEATAAPETTAVPEETEAPEDTEAPAGDVDGMAIYEANCARCHGSDGTGGRGPSLIEHIANHPDKASDIGIVTIGGENMPSFGDKLSEAEIVAVIDYAYETFCAAS